MATGDSPIAIFNSVNNSYALKSFQWGCSQQPDFIAIQQAIHSDNTQVGQAIPAAAEGNVIIPKHTEVDLNKQLTIFLSAAAQLGDKSNFAHQSACVSPQVPQLNPCILNPSGKFNDPHNNFLTPSISGNYGLVDNPQAYLNSLPEIVGHELPRYQMPMEISLHQGQRLLQEQKRIMVLLQQNQHLINLLQKVQDRTPGHSQGNLPQEQVKGSGLLPYCFQDCSKSPVVSTTNDSVASRRARLAQIYANASRQTAITDGLPFTQLNSELASLNQSAAKPRVGDEILKQLFKRIDDMHAALQRSEEEKAKRQPKRSRYVRKSRPRLKLAPQAHEEYIARPGGGQNDGDHQLLTSPVPCVSPAKAGFKKNSTPFAESPSTSAASSLDYYITDGSMVHETGAPNSSPTLQYVTPLQPAGKLAPAQESVLLTDSNNIKLERDCAKNALARDTALAQHEASKLEIASDITSINKRQEDVLPDFDIISYLCSESSPRDDLRTLEDCLAFLMEPVLNVGPSGQGGLSAIVNSFEGEPPTIAGEMHNTVTTQRNSMTVSSNAFCDLEANNNVSVSQVARGAENEDISTCGAKQEVVTPCGVEKEVVGAFDTEQEVVKTCGAKNEYAITILLAEPCRTVAFPDKTELEDGAIRMKFIYDFDNPEGISVFPSCVEGSLEENLELLENCKRMLFARLVDPQTSTARESELGYPDLTEVIQKMDELTEVVGGYWPVSDKCAWMLGFLYPNELLYLKSLMGPEWKTKMDTAASTEDILVSAYWGLRELLMRLGSSEEAKPASDLSRDHNRADANGSVLGSDKFNTSFESGAGFQKQTSLQLKRKRDDDDDEEEMHLPPRKHPTMDAVDFLF